MADSRNVPVRAGKGRADLVYLLASLPPGEWRAAARVTGYAQIEQEAPRPALEVPGGDEAGRVVPASAAPAPEPYRPGALPELPFWRVAKEEYAGPEADGGDSLSRLTRKPVWVDPPLSDPAIPPPRQEELVPPARQSRFFRRQLALPGHGVQLDLERLCGQLARRRLPRRLPRLANPRWPARVHLVLDLRQSLRPFWEDFWHLEARLGHILGRRLRVWHLRGGGPMEAVPKDRRADGLPLKQGALVLLSDAGMYTPGGALEQRWRRFGHACGRAGVRPLLLAPVPERLMDTGLVHWFRVVAWDRATRLHPLRHPVPVATPAVTPVPHPGSDDLLAALADASRVEPPLLRQLRLALDGRGADIGSEYEVWNHPQVRSNPIACALAPEHRADAAVAFRQLKDDRQHLAELRRLGNRHQSPLIRAEEILAEGDLAPPGDREWAEEIAQGLSTSLYRDGYTGLGRELAGYVVGLADRRPDLLARNRELATAWVISRRAELGAGTLRDVPPGVDLASLRELVSGMELRDLFLAQVADGLGVFPAEQDGPICRLAHARAEDGYWEIEPLSAETASPRLVKVGETVELDPESRYRLTLGRRRLELEPVRRPAWAVGIGRVAEVVFVELEEGRRLFWMPRRTLLVSEAVGGEVPDEGEDGPGFDPAHGFWWDEIEYREWLDAGRGLTPPAWASRHGTDEAGFWAEFEVKGVVQRMRWIPPGEFLMGSPEDERERDSDERQHPVVLTRGYWLADTACTQALWQVVLGKTPSYFEGVERPVEQVSWTDVVERFLPALNRRVPGLAAELPSEAQWEYACRAGTQTPFWFGGNITTDQVNYNGKYPYAGGPKGEYRGQTVDVKALPPNGWGLYQMHGNVYEWCADWLGEYPQGEVTDPTGSEQARNRVLRGGSWFINGRSCRSAARRGYEPGVRYHSFGFRLARGSSPRQAGSGGAVGVAAGSGATAAAHAEPARGLGGKLKSLFGKKEEKW